MPGVGEIIDRWQFKRWLANKPSVQAQILLLPQGLSLLMPEVDKVLIDCNLSMVDNSNKCPNTTIILDA